MWRLSDVVLSKNRSECNPTRPVYVTVAAQGFVAPGVSDVEGGDKGVSVQNFLSGSMEISVVGGGSVPRTRRPEHP